MPKHFLNNSKTTLKKSRKRLFRPPKWPKHGCQLGQKCRFLGPFSGYELYFWLTGTEKKIKIVPPDSLRHLKKKKKKTSMFFQKKNQKGKYAHPTNHPPNQPTTHSTSSALEALSTFFRASRGPKGEQEVWVAYRLSNLPKNFKKIGKSPESDFFDP